MISIFAFFLVLTFPDGSVDEFNIATPDVESCMHLQGHLLEWAEAAGIVVEHITECKELISA